MKKLMVMLAAVAMAAGVQAAMVDWKCSATKDDIGNMVYVLVGSDAKTSFANLTEIQGLAISSDVIAQHGSGTRATYYAMVEGVSGVSASDSLYTVVVSADGTKYGVTTPAAAASYVYDPTEQQSSPGFMPVSFTTPTTEFAPGPIPPPIIPEPTSGLLLLLGVAGLALRRRRA